MSVLIVLWSSEKLPPPAPNGSHHIMVVPLLRENGDVKAIGIQAAVGEEEAILVT